MAAQLLRGSSTDFFVISVGCLVLAGIGIGGSAACGTGQLRCALNLPNALPPLSSSTVHTWQIIVVEHLEAIKIPTKCPGLVSVDQRCAGTRLGCGKAGGTIWFFILSYCTRQRTAIQYCGEDFISFLPIKIGCWCGRQSAITNPRQ